MSARRFGWALASVALVAVLGACAPGNDEETPARQDFPVTAFLEEIEERRPDDATRIREIEDLTAACMRDAGFEYVPRPQDVVLEPTGDALPEWGSREFAEQFGYGAATEAALLAAQGFDGAVPEEVAQSVPEGLSPEGTDAYWEALLGPMASGAGPDAPRPDAAAQGCYGRSESEVASRAGGPGDPGIAPLVAEAQDIVIAVDLDGRVLDVVEAWSACMGARGYDFRSPLGAQDEVYAAVARVRDAGTLGDEGDVVVDDETMARLAAEEIATAKADLDCQEEVALTQRRAEVRAELEQQFWDEHGGVIEDWLAQAAG